MLTMLAMLACGQAAVPPAHWTPRGCRDRSCWTPVSGRAGASGGPVCGNSIVEAGESCDDGNNVDGDGCSSDCQVEFFFRDFRLNANALSTPAPPPCTVGNGCFVQWVALSDAGTVATYPGGGSETVTQGTSPVAYSSPLGFPALDFTGQAMRPVITTPSNGLLSLLSVPNMIIWAGSPTNFVEGAGGVEPLWRIQPGGGAQYLIRYENDATLTAQAPAVRGVLESDAAAGLPAFGGWGLRSQRWDGTNLVVRAPGKDSAVISLASALAGTAQPLRINADDGTGNPDFTSGEWSSLTLYAYDAGVDIGTTEAAFAGLAVSQSSPVNFTRSSRSWFWTAAGDVEPFAPNTPVVSARGLEVQSGNDVSGGREIAVGNGWAAKPTDPSTWATRGSPTATAHAMASPFDRYLNTMSTRSGWLITADGGEGYAGDGGTTGCASHPKLGGQLHTVSCFLAPGDAGFTTNVVRLGFDTDATTQFDGGAINECTLTLDAGWARRKCSYIGALLADGGSGSTYLFGHVRQGASDGPGGGGSFMLAQCQCDSSEGAAPPKADNVNTGGGDIFFFDGGEVSSWPDGRDGGFCIEEVFAQNFSSPTELSGLALFSSHMSATANDDGMYLFIDSTDYSAYGQPTLDFALRNHSWQDTCTNGATANSLTDTKSSSLGSLTEGVFYAAKGCAAAIPAVAGADGGLVPRVDHYLYFNACPNQADTTQCHATVPVGNSVGLNKCAGENSFSDWAVLGREVNNTTNPSEAITPMNGVIVKFQVKRAVP